MITMITMAPVLMNMGCSSGVWAAIPAARIQAARRDVSS
jgi:hypothetical protein